MTLNTSRKKTIKNEIELATTDRAYQRPACDIFHIIVSKLATHTDEAAVEGGKGGGLFVAASSSSSIWGRAGVRSKANRTVPLHTKGTQKNKKTKIINK